MDEKKLTAEQKSVLKEGGTEAPYSGKYATSKDKGNFSCAGCGNLLFDADTKFVSTTPGLAGWPSFDDALPGAVKFVEDTSLEETRTEVRCAKCDGHLGHLFENLPGEVGDKHYCINSCALELEEKENEDW